MGAHLQAHSAIVAGAVQPARAQRYECQRVYCGVPVQLRILLPQPQAGHIPHSHAAPRAASRYSWLHGSQRQAAARRGVGGGRQRHCRSAAAGPVRVGVEAHGATGAAGADTGDGGRGGDGSSLMPGHHTLPLVHGVLYSCGNRSTAQYRTWQPPGTCRRAGTPAPSRRPRAPPAQPWVAARGERTQGRAADWPGARLRHQAELKLVRCMTRALPPPGPALAARSGSAQPPPPCARPAPPFAACRR